MKKVILSLAAVAALLFGAGVTQANGPGCSPPRHHHHGHNYGHGHSSGYRGGYGHARCGQCGNVAHPGRACRGGMNYGYRPNYGVPVPNQAFGFGYGGGGYPLQSGLNVRFYRGW